MNQTTEIPQPKSYGPLGNLPTIQKDQPIQSFMKHAQELGPIFQFHFPGRVSTFVSSAALAAELCDESRFDKKVGPALQKVRAFGGDGLFTSETEEPNWKKAHAILLPSFSQQAMKGYHDKMIDLATQLIQKWSRLNPGEAIDVPDDMTRLTLDTIGLCGFNFRFNSFYREDAHPFVDKMVHALDEAMNQSQRLGIQDKLMIRSKQQFRDDIDYMFGLVDDLIAERKKAGDSGEDDLLSHMLRGVDPDTGETLSDENIRFQIITFLIAGHETTSGLLSFALYFLMNHADVLHSAQQEVDAVLGHDIPTYKQVKQLKTVRNILNETLRLWPTAPAFSVYAKEDTTLGGRYNVQKGDTFSLLIPELHRDRTVWGDDAEQFRPERFANPSQIPHHAYKPFGNGQRACIGQQFALHEATLVLGMILQHFDLNDHTNYQLNVKEALTLKPEGLTMTVTPRKQPLMFQSTVPQETNGAEHVSATQSVPDHGTPLLVLYGSNMGTAEGVARELAESAGRNGFDTTIASLNERTGDLPSEGAVIMVSASYNGHPPDNAVRFMDWLSGDAAADGVTYAVFGCGDRNWATTYQRIPVLIDTLLAEKGGTRLLPAGEGDASDDFDGDLEKWQEALWSALAGHLSLELSNEQPAPSLSIDYVSGMQDLPMARSYEADTAIVRENRELLHTTERSTRHLEIELPNGMTYKEGDHLGILPENDPALVNRVLTRFGVSGDTYLVISADGGQSAHLPTDQPIQLHNLLTACVELQEPATRAQLRALAACNPCPPHKMEIEALLQDEEYKQKVLKPRLTMLHILEQFASCEMEFEQFLSFLPPLKARYYSISSSPRVQSDRATITVSVVRDQSWSGSGEYKGTASNYLADRQPGDQLACFIRTPQASFQLPENPAAPVIFVGPGTGVAPFRGFIQARRALLQQGHILGEAHLYFGCRHPEQDFLYEDELKQAERDGLITLHCAFSRHGARTYVQDLMANESEALLGLLESGGHLYICGDGSRMAPAVTATLEAAWRTANDATPEQSQKWLTTLEQSGRLAKDVWSAS